MRENNLIDAIEKVEKVDASQNKQSIETVETVEKAAPDRERFTGFMQEDKSGGLATKEGGSSRSLMDTVRDLHYQAQGTEGTAANREHLVSQTQEAVYQIEQIKSLLSTPQANIKADARRLLHNKLSHIDESLKIALSKAGVEYSPIEVVATSPKTANPIERFIGLLTHGQNQLMTLGDELQTMGGAGKDLSPVNMIAIQVKVSQIQQELELFTSLLNKSLESIKTIMNIQV